MARTDIEDDLAGLATLSLAQLRDKWAGMTDAPVPRVSAGLLRHAIAYELQARVHGDLSRRTRQKLDQLAGGLTTTRDAAPGMRLMRDDGQRLVSAGVTAREEVLRVTRD